MKKRIAIFGSTGSVGRQTLEVIQANKEQFSAFALAAHANVELLASQIQEHHPSIVVVYDPLAKKKIEALFPNVRVLGGMEGLKEMATHPDVDFVMAALSGSVGIIPTIAAIQAGKCVGLANKEVLVAAGDLVMNLVKRTKSTLLPVDSEHSAIFQCLQREEVRNVKKIFLTASGGPFWKFSQKELESVTLEMALSHPTYKMGNKITVDSSTFMNKGLEVIEAYHLFGIKDIEVLVHPQSIIHGFLEFHDGVMIAQFSNPDMRLPIQYALDYPNRKATSFPRFNFDKTFHLDFHPKDEMRFPCLRLAYEALTVGKSLPAFMNAANEILVKRFLQKEIRWIDIGIKLEELMSSHKVINMVDLEAVLLVDEEAKQKAKHI